MRSAVVLGGRFRVFEDGSVFKITGVAETPAKISDGRYLSVYSEKKNYQVHRLIAAAFIQTRKTNCISTT